MVYSRYLPIGVIRVGVFSPKGAPAAVHGGAPREYFAKDTAESKASGQPCEGSISGKKPEATEISV
jgi:hypothetical protein